MQYYITFGEYAVNDNFKYDSLLEANQKNYSLGHFELLTNPHKLAYKWVSSPSGSVPDNAVVCSEEFGQVYYCGRMQVLDKGLMPAKIKNGVAYTHFYYVRKGTRFEYLVYG